ncbi:hypothetical protein HMPREF9714_02637 [Myroides odoratimimus CCUG 12901]|uniref:hypothetical protein n=1 Tax=Myroides odoratimimus TaxID=76832 RepID=UPI0002460992|nr:hypothetical protein [Myroides odoratimimus]EHO07557.1 hypothetical protein HMPREF9714_02637 [Myroides odoratimimus CCUG 12901]MCA4805553.1 hypothetical protein [Myroides odoratimimus]MDM1093920.1 hypothetical protein [Myroides odoratimimus]MDM1400395.1 hypothetical protein [Myroides odoratimimus]MDM1410510.1 hypothetical protein [Myroides odoratimimus]
MKKVYLLVLIFLTSMYSSAQENAPLITGKVNISIKEGTFECDLTLSDIPQLKNYYIRLNSGMNPLHFRSKEPNDFLIYADKSFSDSTSTGETLAYYFADNTKKGKFLPKSLQIRYVGKFPVATDTIENYSREDWKGNIAFNNYSVRADGNQSGWYPVLYDIDKDKAYDRVKYDIELTCKDCTTLYINGNIPVKSQTHRFKSDVPQELAIFSGDYKYSKVDNTYLLNPDIEESQIKEFGHLIESFKKYYTTNIGIPFEQETVFINTTPTSKNNSWMFVSYPSIYTIGWGNNGLKSIFKPKTQNWFRPFIAHELGHYYFGTYKVFNSELGDMMSEGFAEYLSWQLTKDVLGKDIYKGIVSRKIEALDKFKEAVIPFGKIKSQEEYLDRELYVYYYAPLLFEAIRKEIGDKQMWSWLRNILMTKTDFTNYDFLCSTLKETIKDDKKFEEIKTKYFEGKNSINDAVELVKKEF